MDWSFVFGIIILFDILFAIVVVFVERKNPTSALAWLMVLFFLPAIGFVLYLLFGQNYTRRKMFTVKEAGDQLGRFHQDRHLSPRAVQYYLNSESYECLGFCIHPHTLRHTFGTRMMKRTNIRVVQELMGHKSITSTQVYTHPDHDDLNRAINGLDKPHTN